MSNRRAHDGTLTSLTHLLCVAVSLGLVVSCRSEIAPLTPEKEQQAEGPKGPKAPDPPAEFAGFGEASLQGPARSKVKPPNVPDQKYPSVKIVVKPQPKAADPDEMVVEFSHGPFAGCVVPAKKELSGLVARSGPTCEFTYAGRNENRELEIYLKKLGGPDEVEGQVKADLEDALVTFKFQGKRKR